MTRIIAGYAGGRRIKVPETGTRPTSDRAREGLFSSLQARFGFDEARVLDLYAGSGALGLEAASRGASHVDLVDNSPGAIEIMTANSAVIPEASVRIHHATAEDFVATRSDSPERYDMVLADPPYAVGDDEIVELLEALRPLLKDGAAVVIERSSQSPETAWPEGFEPTGQKLKRRTYGAARMDMARYDGPVDG